MNEAKNDGMRKAGRLLEMETLLLQHPEGLTQAEIARKMGVNRSTICRYKPEFGQFQIYLEGDRLFINRSAYLVKVRLTLYEALSLHLAARLLSTQMNRQNPHAASALRKLSVGLDHLAPQISQHLRKTADEMGAESRWHDPDYIAILDGLALAWAETRRVRLWHRSSNRVELKEHILETYYIEPSAAGHCVYVIGRCAEVDDLRTFKVERIEKIEVLREGYTIPEDFNPYELLRDAWGIWYTRKEPEQVTLRFSPTVANRIRENCWHTSEVITEKEDGSLIWRAQIAGPIEMLPWVKGWGADVEVLEPAWMRKMLVEEALALAALYGDGAVQAGA